MGLTADKLHTSNVEETRATEGVIPETVNDCVRNTSEFRMGGAQGISALGQVDNVRLAQEGNSSGRDPFSLVISRAKLNKAGV